MKPAIGKSLRPFILRRTKAEVLKELPEKSEQTLSCEMSTAQKKMYDELRRHYQLHLSKKVKEVGLNRAKIHVLEALLRLRQAACDPRLVKPDCGVRGAKLGSLMEQLDEVIGEGHKALVFSQFTSLLALVREDMDAKGWSYEYLDGKTRKRSESVSRFQECEPVPRERRLQVVFDLAESRRQWVEFDRSRLCFHSRSLVEPRGRGSGH